MSQIVPNIHLHIFQNCKILHKGLEELRQNINQMLDPQITPYLTLVGELWDVFCEYLWENWPHYNSTALYTLISWTSMSFEQFWLWMFLLYIYSCDRIIKIAPCVHLGTCFHAIVFSWDQAALWMVQSFCLSVRPSVTPFSLSSHHYIIMKFSGVITNDRSEVHAKGQGQRSRVKVKVKSQCSCFRTVTQVWIHIWQWNDAQSLMWHRRGDLLLFRVVCQISMLPVVSHRLKNFDPNWGFSDSNFTLNSPMVKNDAQNLK